MGVPVFSVRPSCCAGKSHDLVPFSLADINSARFACSAAFSSFKARILSDSAIFASSNLSSSSSLRISSSSSVPERRGAACAFGDSSSGEECHGPLAQDADMTASGTGLRVMGVGDCVNVAVSGLGVAGTVASSAAALISLSGSCVLGKASIALKVRIVLGTEPVFCVVPSENVVEWFSGSSGFDRCSENFSKIALLSSSCFGGGDPTSRPSGVRSRVT